MLNKIDLSPFPILINPNLHPSLNPLPSYFYSSSHPATMQSTPFSTLKKKNFHLLLSLFPSRKTTTCTISLTQHTSNPVPYPPTQDKVYDGWSGVLIESQHISGTFDCTFHLYRYPFDSQRCSVRMRFARDIRSQLEVEEEGATVRYLGAAILPSHRVHNFTIRRVEEPQGTTLVVGYVIFAAPFLFLSQL